VEGRSGHHKKCATKDAVPTKASVGRVVTFALHPFVVNASWHRRSSRAKSLAGPTRQRIKPTGFLLHPTGISKPSDYGSR
jgi:hypothetical protein